MIAGRSQAMSSNSIRTFWIPGILAFLIALQVNLAPLALGSNRLLPWAFNSLLAGGLLVLTIAWIMTVPASKRRFSPKTVAAPLILYAIVLLWAAVQALPSFPEGLANPIWSVAADAEASITTRSVSVNTDNSLMALMRLSTYASIFLAVFLLASRPERAEFMLWFFVVAAGLYAVYGLARYAADWDKILWYSTDSDRLTGPFINRNSAATYFGIGLVCALALLFRALGRAGLHDHHHGFRFRLVAIAERLSVGTGFLLVICSALLAALMLTASRAGIASAFAGCLALAALRVVKRSRAPTGAFRFAGLGVVVVLFLAALEMSGGHLSARLLAGDLDAGGRPEIYRMTVSAIGDNFWIGTGVGTFQDMFPVFRDDVLAHGLIWDKAHNDYLELFLGLGVPAAALFLLCLAILFTRALRGYFLRRRDSIYCGVAVAVSIVAALHSLVDFSMQIQAIAMAYAMLMALGVAQSRSSRDRASE